MGSRTFYLLIISLAVMARCCWGDDIDNAIDDIDNAIDDDSDEVHAKRSKNGNLIEKLREQIKEKENELENAEKINKNFERMIQLVNIMGQVDTFLTDRTKLVLKKLAMLADDLDGTKSKKAGAMYDIKF